MVWVVQLPEDLFVWIASQIEVLWAIEVLWLIESSGDLCCGCGVSRHCMQTACNNNEGAVLRPRGENTTSLYAISIRAR